MAVPTATRPAAPLGFFDQPTTWVESASLGHALSPSEETHHYRRIIYKKIQKSLGDLSTETKWHIDDVILAWERGKGLEPKDAEALISNLRKYQSAQEDNESEHSRAQLEQIEKRKNSKRNSNQAESQMTGESQTAEERTAFDYTKTILKPTSAALRNFLALLVGARLSVLAKFFFSCIDHKRTFSIYEEGPYLKYIWQNNKALWEIDAEDTGDTNVENIDDADAAINPQNLELAGDQNDFPLRKRKRTDESAGQPANSTQACTPTLSHTADAEIFNPLNSVTASTNPHDTLGNVEQIIESACTPPVLANGMKGSMTWRIAAANKSRPIELSVTKKELWPVSTDWIIAICFSKAFGEALKNAVFQSPVDSVVSDRRALVKLNGPLGDGMRQSEQWLQESGPQTQCFRWIPTPSPEGDDIVCVRVGYDFGYSFPGVTAWYINVSEEFKGSGWDINLDPYCQTR